MVSQTACKPQPGSLWGENVSMRKRKKVRTDKGGGRPPPGATQP
jgi:hypothetical protein